MECIPNEGAGKTGNGASGSETRFLTQQGKGQRIRGIDQFFGSIREKDPNDPLVKHQIQAKKQINKENMSQELDKLD